MPCYHKAHAESISLGVKKYWESLTPEEKLLKTKNFHKYTIGHYHTELSKMRALESRMKGFWYGNIKYKDDVDKKYCELWTEDLRERIRAYWGYVSALSGKAETRVTKSGGIRSISCHHVYYQKKSCCVWDEDEQGYYANINIGTIHNPDIVTHYIDGDPNKFVTLTAKEHKTTDTDKLHWIETFERLIAEQGGKCYFTGKEIDDLLGF